MQDLTFSQKWSFKSSSSGSM